MHISDKLANETGKEKTKTGQQNLLPKTLPLHMFTFAGEVYEF